MSKAVKHKILEMVKALVADDLPGAERRLQEAMDAKVGVSMDKRRSKVAAKVFGTKVKN
jgi:hypothetical protein